VDPGSFKTLVQPIMAARLRQIAGGSTRIGTPHRPIYSTICKLFSGKFVPYWAVGVVVTAPVPQLIVVRTVLWVINTLHDPGSLDGTRLPPVPHALARYGNAISARLLIYSWIHDPGFSTQSPTVIGELSRLIGEALRMPIPYAWCCPYDSHAYYATGFYLLSYRRHSHPYHSSAGHDDHTPSSPPHPLYGPSRYPTGPPYPVLVRRPLRCRPDLIIGSHQRGVTEKEQTCGLSIYHRPCLSFGLSWLVLPIIRSVR